MRQEQRSPARLGGDIEPGPMSPHERDLFLRRPLLARLATVQPDGAPFIVPLWFQWDGEAFYLVVREKAQFLAHIRHEPRVCVSIASETPPYARVTAQGRAELIPPEHPEHRWRELTRIMTDRYVGELDPGYANRTGRFPRWVVRVAPERLISWRGGGWHRRYTE